MRLRQSLASLACAHLLLLALSACASRLNSDPSLTQLPDPATAHTPDETPAPNAPRNTTDATPRSDQPTLPPHIQPEATAPPQTPRSQQTDPPDRELEEPDRRVIVAILLRNGSRDDPDGRGRARFWAAPDREAIPALRDRIEHLYKLGARRIALVLPAGTPPDDRMGPLQIAQLAEPRRNRLEQLINQLNDRWPDIQIGIYAGFGIDTDPSTIAFEDDWRVPDFNDPDDRRAIIDQYKSVPEMGFEFLVLDAISGRASDGYGLEWINLLQKELRIRVIGEAYPFRIHDPKHSVDQSRTPPEEQIHRGRWMALWRYNPLKRLKLPGDTEHYVGIHGGNDIWRDGSPQQVRQLIDYWVDRGFVPFLYTGDTERYDQGIRYAIERMAREPHGQ